MSASVPASQQDSDRRNLANLADDLTHFLTDRGATDIQRVTDTDNQVIWGAMLDNTAISVSINLTP